jgi:hypothetical protein
LDLVWVVHERLDPIRAVYGSSNLICFVNRQPNFLFADIAIENFLTSMHTGLKICSPCLFLFHIQMKLHIKERVMCNTYIPHTPLSWILCHCSIRKMCEKNLQKFNNPSCNWFSCSTIDIQKVVVWSSIQIWSPGKRVPEREAIW